MSVTAAHDVPVAPSPTPAPVERARVLIVDDMGTIRMVLSRQVERLGHAVTSAGDGREALALLREGDFDLVLLDVIMPEMDGYAVLDAMQADVRLREVPVIVISAVDEIDSVVRCIERGAADYLHKPCNPTLLRARVGACLEKKRLADERRQAYERLRELETLKDSLTHMVVHDLRTPLCSFISGLRALPTLGELSGDQQEIWQIAMSGGETLLRMVDELLDISKMEAGSMQAELTETSAVELLELALLHVGRLASDKGLEVVRELPGGLPPFRCDENKMVRVLVNLLGNAIKFTPVGGRITFSCARTAENELLFTVRDTGEGMPEEALGRIFDKFAQVESRKAGRKGSTGLGLTFCKMTVELHGGRIWAESRLGEGSALRFTLPL